MRAEVLESLHSAHQGVNGMSAHARTRLFWPGLDASLKLTRAQCKPCNSMAPSQSREPLAPPPNPEYPFQQTVTDFFDLRGINYLIYADRYTGWVEVALMPNGRFSTVAENLRNWFVTYGAPEELASDGGPPFKSSEYDTFLRNWGVYKRQSSAYYPQSNGRAELAVKSAKRILSDNVDGSGRLNHDRVARALLVHRNTPVADINMSPAVMLYGRPIRDHLPALRQHYTIRKEWTEIRDLREAAMAKRHMRNEQFYNKHTSELPELDIGDCVIIQNQHGSYPRRWHTTGKIVEDLGHRQYNVLVDGSNRVTMRNRRFLKKILPVVETVRPPFPDTPRPDIEPNVCPPHIDNGDINVQPSTPPPQDTAQPPVDTEIPTAASPPSTPLPDAGTNPEEVPFVEPTPIAPEPRRSTRQRKPRRALSPQMRGKSHGYSDDT